MTEEYVSLIGQQATTSNISFLHFLPFPYIQKCIFSKIPPTLPCIFRMDYKRNIRRLLRMTSQHVIPKLR